MNRSISLSSSLANVVVRTLAAGSLAAVVVGCAADLEDDAATAVVVAPSTNESEMQQTREHILLAAPADTTESSRFGTIGTITAGPRDTRCGNGSTCTETSANSCDDFRKKCKETAGCGTTSTGAGDIAVVSCIAIPTRPE